jgi:outer membrane lipoprotein carrier protein
MRLLVILLVVITTTILTAQGQDTKTSLQQYLDNLQSYEANFQQQRYSVNRQLIDTTSGRFILKRPNQFIWQTFAPFEQTISSDGQSIWTLDIDLEQVIINPVDEEVANAPIYLLTQDQQSINTLFNVEHQAVDGTDFFVLTPIDESGTFERIRLGFSQGILNSLELYDSLGQLTRISMTNIRNNPIVDISQFQLSIPDDYDVIDNRPIESVTQ